RVQMPVGTLELSRRGPQTDRPEPSTAQYCRRNEALAPAHPSTHLPGRWWIRMCRCNDQIRKALSKFLDCFSKVPRQGRFARTEGSIALRTASWLIALRGFEGNVAGRCPRRVSRMSRKCPHFAGAAMFLHSRIANGACGWEVYFSAYERLLKFL